MEEDAVQISQKTREILQERVYTLENEIKQLEKAKAELEDMLPKEDSIWEGSTCAECGENLINNEKFVTEHKKDCKYYPTSVAVRTGAYWYKNRFKPEEGYSTIPFGYRIVYELQDEGPNFISGSVKNGTFGMSEVWPTIQEARGYVERCQNKGTIYTIIAPDGEIVK